MIKRGDGSASGSLHESAKAFVSCCSADGKTGKRHGSELGDCSGQLNFAEAKAFCVRGKMRLCTATEVIIAKGTGCNYDSQNVWTSTEDKSWGSGGGGSEPAAPKYDDLFQCHTLAGKQPAYMDVQWPYTLLGRKDEYEPWSVLATRRGAVVDAGDGTAAPQHILKTNGSAVMQLRLVGVPAGLGLGEVMVIGKPLDDGLRPKSTCGRERVRCGTGTAKVADYSTRVCEVEATCNPQVCCRRTCSGVICSFVSRCSHSASITFSRMFGGISVLSFPCVHDVHSLKWLTRL